MLDLYTAAKEGDLPKLKELLAHPKVELSWTAGGGLTALHISSYKGRASVVDLLLAAGASPGATEDEGRTPLHLAAEEGHVETVKLLVAHEAPTGAQTQAGNTPLHCARNGACVTLLISAGANVAAQNKAGETPLHTVARQVGRRESALQTLVASGATLDAVNKAGQTPRDVARASNRAVIDRLRLTERFENQVPPRRFKLLLSGNGTVGKTTLGATLQRSEGGADATDQRTHGFDVFPATVPGAGDCIIFDFGG